MLAPNYYLFKMLAQNNYHFISLVFKYFSFQLLSDNVLNTAEFWGERLWFARSLGLKPEHYTLCCCS